MLNLEEQARLARIKAEANELGAEDLRQVLVSTWSLWLNERKFLQAVLEQEGITCKSEVNRAFPLELAQRLRGRETACALP